MTLEDRLKKVFNMNAVLIYFGLNPLVISILCVYFKAGEPFTDLEHFTMGLYIFIWVGYGLLYFFIPQLFSYIKDIKQIQQSKKKKTEPRSMDEIIDDAWKEHNEEKKQEHKQ